MIVKRSDCKRNQTIPLLGQRQTLLLGNGAIETQPESGPDENNYAEKISEYRSLLDNLASPNFSKEAGNEKDYRVFKIIDEV